DALDPGTRDRRPGPTDRSGPGCHPPPRERPPGAAGKRTSPLHRVPRPRAVHAMQLGPEGVLAVSDDRGGIGVARVREAAGRTDRSAIEMDDEAALYLIFRSGLTTATKVTDVSGRGVGLDAVRASLNAVRGRIEVRSDPVIGTEFRIAVPITMATLRCLVITAGGQ